MIPPLSQLSGDIAPALPQNSPAVPSGEQLVPIGLASVSSLISIRPPKWPGPRELPSIPHFHKVGHDFWLPHFEAAVLSVLINFPGKIAETLDGLTPEHFYDKHNVTLAFTIARLHNEKNPTDPASIIQALRDAGKGPLDDWITYVFGMAAVRVDPDDTALYKRRLDRAVRLRGGESYSVHSYDESFYAELVRAKLPMTLCVGEQWHDYAAGVWERKTRNAYRTLVRECIHPHQRTHRRMSDLVGHVESSLQVDEEEFFGAYKMANGHVLINAQNGVIEVAPDGAIGFRDHSLTDRFTLKLAASYDPSAVCPTFDRFLGEALPDKEDRGFCQIFNGYILYPDCDFETCAVFFGPGETGKSTLATALRDTLGSNLCSSVGLEELCKPGSYSLPTLKFKLLNIGSELNGTEVEESSNYKMLVSGDYLNARQIYGKPAAMRATAKLLFLSNHMPRFKKGSDAELRRLRMVDFSQKPAAKDPQLKSKFGAETSGILNWMLQGLVALRKENGIPRAGADSEKLLTVFAKLNDPIGRYIEECFDFDTNSHIPKAWLLAGFVEWSEQNGTPVGPNGESWFFRMLRPRFPKLGYGHPSLKGKRVRVIYGLRLSEERPLPKELTHKLSGKILLSPTQPKELPEEAERQLAAAKNAGVAWRDFNRLEEGAAQAEFERQISIRASA